MSVFVDQDEAGQACRSGPNVDGLEPVEVIERLVEVHAWHQHPGDANLPVLIWFGLVLVSKQRHDPFGAGIERPFGVLIRIELECKPERACQKKDQHGPSWRWLFHET